MTTKQLKIKLGKAEIKVSQLEEFINDCNAGMTQQDVYKKYGTKGSGKWIDDDHHTSTGDLMRRVTETFVKSIGIK